LCDGVYDLRASNVYIGKRRGLDPYRHGWCAFQAGFSRAVRGLVKRAVLYHIDFLVPVIATDECEPLRLSDGDFVRVSGRQVRFVTRKPETADMHNA
jgi:hypothetical protein